MNSVAAHYPQRLAPIYSRMSESVEAALEAGKAEIGEALQQSPASSLAVDLGETSGFEVRRQRGLRGMVRVIGTIA